MNEIDFFHSYDAASKTLTLRNASYIPEAIFNFSNQIEILDASQGTLNSLPSRFPELSNLKIVFFSKNDFTEIPSVLAECPLLRVVGFKSCRISTFPENSLPPNLQWLILTDNQLSKLPNSIGNLKKLKKLALAVNRLEELPEQMSECQSLELLRLSANCLKNEPPSWVFELTKLAWYSDSGNLFQSSSPQINDLPQVSYDQIKLLRLLGQSPSSEVWEGQVEGFTQAMAVKKYKGNITSDGYIADDLQSCVLAGSHNNIITVKARVHPKSLENDGLIMDLIPRDYKTLGRPPSLESCTRDTFPSNTNFSIEFIISCLKSIASAMSHLHEKGLTHGDLYAHNILCNNAGHCFLGDFGAASRYDPKISRRREYLESRAFGYLMEDLLQRCSCAIPEPLIQLKDQCLSAEVKKRPLMNDIESYLLADAIAK